MLNRVIKVTVLITTVLVVLLKLFGVVYAEETTEYSITNQNISVSFNNEDTAINKIQSKIVYSATIQNNSEKFLVSELHFILPNNVQLLNVEIDSKKIIFENNETGVSINLLKSSIDLGKTAVVTMTFNGEQVEEIADFKRIYIPSFDFVGGENNYNLTVQVPNLWGKMRYISSNYSTQNDVDYRLINIDTVGEAMLVFGDEREYFVQAEWRIDNTEEQKNYRLPIPKSPLNSFVFSELTNTARAIQDSVQNEYLLLQLDKDQIHTGNFSGSAILQNQFDGFTSQIGNLGYLANVEELGIEIDQDSNKIYLDLLDKLTPQVKSNIIVRKYIKDINDEDSHTSLDYASALVALFRKKNIESEVVYGVANYPKSSVNHLHYWVLYKSPDTHEWIQADPYFQDLFGYDFYMQVTPTRLAWGILEDFNDCTNMGIQYYGDFDKLLIFQGDPIEVKQDYNVTVNIFDETYSGKNLPINLIIHNDGNTSIYLKELKLGNRYMDQNELKKYLIIPEGVEIIPINGVFVLNPLTSGEYKLNGFAVVEVDGEDIEIPFQETILLKVDHNTIYTNSIILLFIVFISYFMIRKYIKRKH